MSTVTGPAAPLPKSAASTPAMTAEPGLTAHETVYRALRSRIMTGALPPGQTLTLRGLAEEFSVSMTPARESVRRLAAEGALMLSPSGRVTTPSLTRERLEELAAIRALLETELASRALPRAHMALLERMEALNDGLERVAAAGDALGYVRANLEFHRTLYLRAQAPSMLSLVETVWLQLGPTMAQLYAEPNKSRAAFRHRKILAALKAGDEPGLRLALREDVAGGLRMVMGG